MERKHLPMSELCERAMMRKQQVTQNVNQLENKNLVLRVRTSENRRVVWLEPTEQPTRSPGRCSRHWWGS